VNLHTKLPRTEANAIKWCRISLWRLEFWNDEPERMSLFGDNRMGECDLALGFGQSRHQFNQVRAAALARGDGFGNVILDCS